MELRHLRYFIAAAEEEHFGRASDRLHVTRPAVSQIIADLESELGVPLFHRLSHQVKLTAAGRTLLPELQSVMSDLHDAIALTKRVGQGKSGALSIGYGTLTLQHSLFRRVIKEFHETYPDVALSLHEMATSEQPRALAEGKIKAGFMHFGPEFNSPTSKRPPGVLGQDRTLLEWFEIQNGRLGVAVPHDHRLAKLESVCLQQLAGEGFVVVPQSSSSPGYGVLYALCQCAGFEPRIVQEVSSIASQLNLISVGMGAGLVVMGNDFSYPSTLAVVPLLDVDYTTTFLFGWIRGQKDPALQCMIDIVQRLSRQVAVSPGRFEPAHPPNRSARITALLQ